LAARSARAALNNTCDWVSVRRFASGKLFVRLQSDCIEYIAIERAVQKIKNEGNTVGEIRAAFERSATIDDIKSITARDLDITKEGDRVVISYAYTYSIPLMDNVRLVIDFSGTTRDRATKTVP